MSRALPVRPSPCRTCIFHPGNPMHLAPGRLAEIQAYLIRGTPHVCHTPGHFTCRGGRDYQLQIWHRMGLIPEPTDAALAEAMRALGLEPPPEGQTP